MKISFFTLGCKLNQAETEEIKELLQKYKISIVPFKEGADIVVIRACAVTSGASKTTREKIRQAKKRGSYIIAGGCLENKNMSEIDFIATLPIDIVNKILSINNEKNSTDIATEAPKKTRLMIKIQNGCNFQCSYCIIPSFRGQSQSVSVEKIINKINIAEQKGYKEVILTGVNICQYLDKNDSKNELNLGDLLYKILKETKIARIRLGSLDPRLISKKLFRLYSNKLNTTRLMPHWHLSLQSGSDSILKAMNRGYTSAQYLDIINELRNSNPLFSFTTDIIVGFPGESEADFNKSIDIVKQIMFTKVHVFPFSSRPNTQAALLENTVQDKIKTTRVSELIKISDITSQKFINKFANKSRPVLFEQKTDIFWTGYTPEYIKVAHKTKKDLTNQILSTKVV